MCAINILIRVERQSWYDTAQVGVTSAFTYERVIVNDVLYAIQ